MAFGKKKLDNDNDMPIDENPTVALPLTENKATRLAALIKQGGQTKDTLMAAIEVNAAGLASQLSYLNTKGLNIAEIAPDKAEFPMKGEDGVYFMAPLADYMQKRGSGSNIGATKTRTVAELKEFAQKREDTASAKAAKAKDKHEANTADNILRLKSEIADAELQLASALLAAIERGDYSYESCKVSDA